MADVPKSSDSISAWSSTTSDSTGPSRRSKRARKQQQRVIHVEGIPESVPAFLRKTYYILNSGEFADCIHWLDDGQTIAIPKVKQFATTVLPQFFKHSNYASFVRQLNMYGFHKTSPDPTCREFRHEHFLRGRPELVANIKRKVSGVSRPKPSPGQTGADDQRGSAGGAAHGPPAGSVELSTAQHRDQRVPLPSATPKVVLPRALPASASTSASQAPGPCGSTFEAYVSQTPALQTRKDVDSMLEEIVKLRSAQDRLQRQISSMKQRAHASDASLAAVEREAAHSASRQSATQRRLERLMMFTYELYKSLWLVHQRSNRAGAEASALPATAAQPMLTDGTLLDSDGAGDAVQKIFFSAQGLVSPDQFVRMLDYVDVDTPAFAAMHRDTAQPSGVPRLHDGALNDQAANSKTTDQVPPILSGPVSAASAFSQAASLAKDLASDTPPPAKQARLQIGGGNTLQQKSTVQQVAALGASTKSATPAPSGIFTSAVPHAAPPAPISNHELETNSLASVPMLNGNSPRTSAPFPDSVPIFSPTCSTQQQQHSETSAQQRSAPSLCTAPLVDTANSPLAIDSLADENELKGISADKFAAELSSLVNVQDELSSAEHTLLGNLATTDAQLASDFPEEHAAFSMKDGDTGSHSGGSDPAGLRLLDLDLE